MNRRLIILITGLLAACTTDIRTPDAPDDLLSHDSMVVVMRELVVLESYLQTRYQHVENYHKIMSASGKKCLKKYRISPERFERSYAYYVSRQEELQGIYSQVIDSLTRKVNELDASGAIHRDTVRAAHRIGYNP